MASVYHWILWPSTPSLLPVCSISHTNFGLGFQCLSADMVHSMPWLCFRGDPRCKWQWGKNLPSALSWALAFCEYCSINTRRVLMPIHVLSSVLSSLVWSRLPRSTPILTALIWHGEWCFSSFEMCAKFWSLPIFQSCYHCLRLLQCSTQRLTVALLQGKVSPVIRLVQVTFLEVFIGLET